MSVKRKAPTLNDVARQAGVSTATVSRCLNFPDQVTAKTRETVMSAVRKLAYSPNFGARVMAVNRTNTIGAIIPTMENAIFARGLQAFQEELRRHGYTLLVASSSYRADIEEEQIRSMVSRGADGLLLIGHERDPAIYRFLETQDVPALVAWSHDCTKSLPSIGFDNRKSMRALAEKVIEMGHRRMAVISAAMKTNDRASLRVHGIRDAMNSAGLDPAELPIIETTYSIDAGAQAFDQLLAAPVPPTAVICGNDVLAVGAIKQARALGLDVPGDVSVTGFDDIELATIVEPALTTVHVPHRDMGTRSASMLIGLVEKKCIGEAIELEADVRLRGSLAPPRA
ncbi:LacI family DNA-binding transcriptional regulator [Sedimentitalea todarodis]|uniref:LacI family DNA-binding transcriptional regulator n=1 Tax=Sedimentitalea todarodis TaxID=1631240 RepID=A0ABU3VIF5_9RHOB|nr:LacI family DNA-binding transcriptional regulator [Sedimentitalea todarodis]MDU9005972.1 LacI family DNA-binding transcriptional regulator [Sedimentitalea todarodis]